jgi:hypothetical protein
MDSFGIAVRRLYCFRSFEPWLEVKVQIVIVRVKSMGRCLPNEAVRGHREATLRENAALPKTLDHCEAVAKYVIWHEIEIRRDDRTKEIAESHVDGREVVEGADTHAHDMFRSLACLSRQSGN